MKLITYYHQSLTELEQGIDYIFAFKDFSRQGVLELSAQEKMLALKEQGVSVILEIDILVTENDFAKLIKKIEELDPRLLSRVRVQDPGVLNFFLKNYPKSKIQLVLETGNHNLRGIKKWCEFVGENLERVVLSVELAKEKLREIVGSLNCPVELLGLGPVLVFYTPRKLLSASFDENSLNDEELMALGTSEESPHKGFPLTENQFGTFMYHIKDFCLLGEMKELKEMGIKHFRFDPRLNQKHFDLISLVHKHVQGTCCEEEIKKVYGKDWMKGYYRVNKSNVLFPKLKNNRIKREDAQFCGRVIEVVKEHYIAIEVKEAELILGASLRFITPEGKEIESTVKSLRDVALKDQKNIPRGKVALINYKKSVWPKSSVYYS